MLTTFNVTITNIKAQDIYFTLVFNKIAPFLLLIIQFLRKSLFLAVTSLTPGIPENVEVEIIAATSQGSRVEAKN